MLGFSAFFSLVCGCLQLCWFRWNGHQTSHIYCETNLTTKQVIFFFLESDGLFISWRISTQFCHLVSTFVFIFILLYLAFRTITAWIWSLVPQMNHTDKQIVRASPMALKSGMPKPIFGCTKEKPFPIQARFITYQSSGWHLNCHLLFILGFSILPKLGSIVFLW